MTVKLWDNAECVKTYGNAAPGGIMDHMLCAGKQGKDSCSVSFFLYNDQTNGHKHKNTSLSLYIIGLLFRF